MTVYPPKGRNTGAAVVVFPGGGYWVLAMDLEGTEVCDWLTSRGITCVLLKYRVPGDRLDPRSGPYPDSPMALEDAQRTVGLVRHHAAEWKIDPQKIGVLGFSAGGHLVAAISTHFERRLYPAVDAADKESCRPDFAVALYPGHLWIDDDKFELNPDVPVTKQTPPTFLLQAEPVAGLLHRPQRRRGPGRDASLRAGGPRLRPATDEVPDQPMAGAGGEMAGYDRDDFPVNGFGVNGCEIVVYDDIGSVSRQLAYFSLYIAPDPTRKSPDEIHGYRFTDQQAHPRTAPGTSARRSPGHSQALPGRQG
jgi:dienelactone hydrolase